MIYSSQKKKKVWAQRCDDRQRARLEKDIISLYKDLPLALIEEPLADM